MLIPYQTESKRHTAVPLIVHPGLGWRRFWQCCTAPNCPPDFIVAVTWFHLLALFMIPGVPCNHRVVVDSPLLDRLFLWRGSFHFRSRPPPPFAVASKDTARRPHRLESNIMFVVYTTGSTGHPKPVQFTRTMLRAQSAAIHRLYPGVVAGGATVLVGMSHWFLMCVFLGVPGSYFNFSLEYCILISRSNIV